MEQDRFQAGAIGHTGNGGFGHGLHLPYQYLSETQMVGIADPDPDGRREAKSATDAEHDYADYHELLSKHDLDVVSIGPRVPTEHEAMVTAAADAGVHILIEKPLAKDVAAADRMLQICAENGVKMATALPSRYVEPFQTAREMIKDGELGEIRSLHARGKEDHRGGGEDLLVLGHHVLDLMRYLTDRDPEWVFGYVTDSGRSAKAEDAMDPSEPIGPVLGDRVTGLYGFPDGIRGYVYSGRDHQETSKQYGITVVGSDGVLSIQYSSLERPQLSRAHAAFEAPGEFEPVSVEPQHVPDADLPDDGSIYTTANALAVRDLLEAAQNDDEPRSSGRDARFALEMIHGVTHSHLEERPITFPLDDRKHPLE